MWRLYFTRLYPDVMLDANIDDMRFYADYPQITGMIQCGQAYYSMADLEFYILDRLMWQPKLNANKMINSFMNAYYGKAAPYMKRYLNLIRKTVKTKPHRQRASAYAPGILEDGLAGKSISFISQSRTGSKK